MNSCLLYCFTPFGYLRNLIVLKSCGSAEYYTASELIQLKDLLKISDSLFTYHEKPEGMEYLRHDFKNLLASSLTSFFNAIK